MTRTYETLPREFDEDTSSVSSTTMRRMAADVAEHAHGVNRVTLRELERMHREELRKKDEHHREEMRKKDEQHEKDLRAKEEELTSYHTRTLLKSNEIVRQRAFKEGQAEGQASREQEIKALRQKIEDLKDRKKEAERAMADLLKDSQFSVMELKQELKKRHRQQMLDFIDLVKSRMAQKMAKNMAKEVDLDLSDIMESALDDSNVTHMGAPCGPHKQARAPERTPELTPPPRREQVRCPSEQTPTPRRGAGPVPHGPLATTY